jgi:hypothetical protein
VSAASVHQRVHLVPMFHLRQVLVHLHDSLTLNTYLFESGEPQVTALVLDVLEFGLSDLGHIHRRGLIHRSIVEALPRSASLTRSVPTDGLLILFVESDRWSVGG